MSSIDARDAVVAAIVEVAPDVDATDLDGAEDLWEEFGLDSMDQVNVMIAIYESTGVEIPERAYPGLRSLAQLSDYVAGSLPDRP